MEHKNKQLSSPLTPLTSNKRVTRTPSNDVGWHAPAHKKKLFSNEEQSHTIRKDACNKVLLQKCDLDQTCGESVARNIEIVDHATEDLNLKAFAGDKKEDETKLISIHGFNRKKYTLPNERISKDFKFCDENLKSSVESGKSEGSKSNILTAVDHNCKRNKNNFEEQTSAECHNCECNNELKLDAVVEYTTNRLDRRCGENSNIKTCVLPCKVESDSECLHEVRATMSVVLSQSKQSSVDSETKLKTPVKVDASCSEAGWETIGIATLPDAEVGDVTISLCKCSKTMQMNCSLSQKHTATNFSNKRVMKKSKLESKLFSNVKELELPHNRCKKEIAEIPHHQMSITSYFKSSRQSSHSLKNPTDGGTEDVTSANSSIAVSQDSHCFKSYDVNTARKEYVGNSCEAPKQSKCLKPTCFLSFCPPLSLNFFVILAGVH
jgi:hypothetical protein